MLHKYRYIFNHYTLIYTYTHTHIHSQSHSLTYRYIWFISNHKHTSYLFYMWILMIENFISMRRNWQFRLCQRHLKSWMEALTALTLQAELNNSMTELTVCGRRRRGNQTCLSTCAVVRQCKWTLGSNRGRDKGTRKERAEPIPAANSRVGKSKSPGE